ncbi:retrotransposon protein, putative, ty1-copia subclass [Tanacetum coccineum]
MLQDVKSYLGRCFAMKDLGEAAYILGIKIYKDISRQLIGLRQSSYIEKILKRYHMENSKRGSIPMQDKLRLSKSQGASTPAELKRMQSVPYASVVGFIMYAVRCTRPDVVFAQNITSRFQQNPGDLYWTTVKNILKVSCYIDAGYLTDADDLKSQTGYVFVLNGGTVNWKSAKQSIFATSSAEAEYIAAFDASKEAVWSRITKGARHFRAKVHYLREVIEFGDIKLEKVHTDDNLADPFTKALAFPKHSELTRNIGMLPASSFISDNLVTRFTTTFDAFPSNIPTLSPATCGWGNISPAKCHWGKVDGENMVCFYAELGMLNYEIVIKFSPSIVAAAALYATCASSDKSHMWRQILEMQTDLNEMQVLECAKMMVEIHLVLKDDEERNWRIYQKYSSETQGAVTLMLAA